ncbi:hypothetical protein JCM10450v2_005945 [Rhodotorula kratochvilovae]
MAAPIDPGPAIQWAKRPDYTTRLVAAIRALPDQDSRHLVFSAATRKSADWKQRKHDTLDQLTRAVFTAQGDAARAKKQLDSVQRRITAIGKEYSNHILSLKADPYSEATTLASIRHHDPHFDDLRLILGDHPEFEQWGEGQNVLPADDDPMQDVHFPIAGPANPAPAAPAPAPAAPAAPHPTPPSPQHPPHQPVAGPAYPNPHLAHLHAQQQHPAPAPAPAPAAAAAAAAALNSSPRDAAAQAALKRARDPRSPSPPRGAPPPPPAAPVVAPAPAPVAVAVHAEAPLQEGALSHCPKCDLALGALGSAEAEEEHLRQCLDAGGATVQEFFICDDKSLPKDDKTNEPLECIMCFDEFSPSERLARLSCYCVFHEGCIVEYWRTPSKFCPTHRELDSTQEVEMRA